MTERRDQGAPSPTAQAEDAWWAAVYARDADTPQPARVGSVDDWFASALGAMGAADADADTDAEVDAGVYADPGVYADAGARDAADAPEVGEDAPVPDVPAPPDLPPIPDVPQIPDLPDVGDVPDIPDVPEQPDLPEGPDLPDVSHDARDRQDAHDAHDARDVRDWGTVHDVEDAHPPRNPDPRVIAPRAEPDSVPVMPPRPPLPRSEPDPSQLAAPEPEAPVNPPSPAPGSAARPAAQSASTPIRLAKKPERATVPTPTLPDGMASRWGRSRPGTTALPEPDSLPEADPDALGAVVPDTALELAHHGSMTLRAASARGERARGLGLPRTDRLLVARFGQGVGGLLVAVVAGDPGGGASGDGGPGNAQQAAQALAAAVGRSRAGLLADLREGAQEQLRYGLQRLTARAARELGPGGAVHALIAPLDPTNRLRAGFGTGPGALLLLGDDAWYDAYAGRRLEAGEAEAEDASVRQSDGFRFRAVVPEPGDVLLLCSEGLAAPLRTEAAVAGLLAEHWSQPHAPSGVDFLRQLQARAQGHTADRTAVAVWQD
ncbi:hypothetical protein [Streptacidiphilus fuscans]|uniref:Protein phosphatase 2C-like protein n=1 Tax=Streptacidiphilus fuscans TaxID=2789292 RepID=A0A931B638_9ACTN|nr:hypothetical protein [Streptacidiphilus fuscans]MBF9070871.1 hypothetical protein [Streptacidiphilus fuscans]